MPFSYLTIIHHIFTGQLLFTAQFRVLLNTAQFGIFLLLFTAHFVFGLLFTAQFQNCCYLRHNSEKSPVVIHDTVRLGLLFSAQLWWVVSADTICGGSVQNSNGCYSRHSSEFLLGGCYAAHNCPPALLASTQFAPLLGTAHCFSAHSCVVRLGTKPLLRPAQFGCYPRHSSSYFLK